MINLKMRVKGNYVVSADSNSPILLWHENNGCGPLNCVDLFHNSMHCYPDAIVLAQVLLRLRTVQVVVGGKLVYGILRLLT